MAMDDADRATELLMRLDDLVHARPMPTGPVWLHCLACGEPIPEGRQGPGVTRCWDCQSEYERRQRRREG